jgi:CheY-like chemotaxis protein
MGKPNILLAEDNPTNTLIVRTIFEMVGLAVRCVENGRSAVEVSATERFDLILMDVQMPVMDGLTAIRQIRHTEAITGRRPSCIYTVTTNCTPQDRRASLDAGANGHITKPLQPELLLRALASIEADQPMAVA